MAEIKIGNLIVTKRDVEVAGQKVNKTFLCIGLGNKNPKKPEWDQTVEITVKDSKGKVLARQTDGFLELVDPRKLPDDLFAAGKIEEEAYEKMKQNVPKIPEKIKYNVRMKT